ncbi:MAG: hypothetical protein RTV41_12065 [Candidatus Thorarchaeota archaeon]
MVTMQQFIEVIERTHEVYDQVDETTHPAWKVILGFYLALQIIDADLFKTYQKRPLGHGSVDPPRTRAPNMSSRNDMVWMFYQGIYTKYIAFYKLSRNARYKPEYYHPVSGDPISKVKGWLTDTFLPMKLNL